MVIILGLLSFCSVVTCVLKSPRNRYMIRWHLEHVEHLSYQQWLDCLISISQLCLLLLFIAMVPNLIMRSDILDFLQTFTWHWQMIFYTILYMIALVEITLLLLVALFDLALKKDSRLLFKKMNWLAFRPEKPKLSVLVVALVSLSDALVYLGILLFFAKTSLIDMSVLILGYAIVKASRYTVWSHQLLAICLFTVISIWCTTATLLYGWGIGLFLLLITYLLISFKEQH